jgi:peptidoglycan hydrolase-like protein with peptidoglycan-binding domain
MPTTILHPWPTVRRPEQGDVVRTVQHLFRARGHKIAVDCDFGPKTERSVRAFQAAIGLVADGIVGRRTWAALILTVKRNDRGDAVRAVQHLLASTGPDRPGRTSFAVDGLFGGVTEWDVKSAQARAGVTVDGVVGPATWHAILGVPSAD